MEKPSSTKYELIDDKMNSSDIALHFSERAQELTTIIRRRSSGSVINVHDAKKYSFELDAFHTLDVPLILARFNSSLLGLKEHFALIC